MISLDGVGSASRKKEVDEQSFDGGAVVPGLVIGRRFASRLRKPVQSAHLGEHRQRPVVAQVIVVDQVLAAEGDAEHLLRHDRLNRVLDLPTKVAPRESQPTDTSMVEAGCESHHRADRPIGRAEQQRAGVRGDLPTVERGHHLASFDRFITEQVEVKCVCSGSSSEPSPVQCPDAPARWKK
jgi:hypothetical protein